VVQAHPAVSERTRTAGVELKQRSLTRTRRWDWRFLLPPVSTDSLVDVVNARDAEIEALSTLTGWRVAGSAGSNEAQVVVLLAGTNTLVSEVVRRSPAAHTVLVTVDRRRGGNVAAFPPRLCRTLRSLGFDQVALYWAKPHLSEPSDWIPMRSTAALRWYLETRLRRRNLALSWVAVLGLKWIRPAATALELVAPTYAIVATRSTGSEDGRPGSSAVPAAAAAGAARDERISAVAIVAGGEGPWGRVTFVPFAGSHPEPVRVIKAPRLPAHNASATREQNVLRTLAATGSCVVAGGVPRALGTIEHGGLELSVESYVQAAGLHLLLSQWPHQRMRTLRGLELATDWLIALARATMRPATAESLRAVALQPVEQYADLLADDGAQRELLSATATHVASWAGSLPDVMVHHDFAPWNVLTDGERIFVIDWEHATRGLPLSDLLFLLMHSVWQSHPRPDAARESLDLLALIGAPSQSNPMLAAGQRLIGRYLAELGVDREAIRPILVVGLVQQALHQRSRLLEAGQVGDEVAANLPATHLRYLAERVASTL
jgi:aminoglycoside phosphotransferase (APT) family kinase protein